jgi:hypothetical protein
LNKIPEILLENRTINNQTPNSKFWKYLAILTIILFCISIITVLYISKQQKITKNKLQDADRNNEVLTTRLSFLQDASSKVAEDLAIFRGHQVIHTKLKSKRDNDKILACVYWDKNSSTVFLDNCGLEQANEGQQYQLWAMQQQQVISLGLIENTNIHVGLQKMRLLKNANGFLLSIEQIGGSQKPTNVLASASF